MRSAAVFASLVALAASAPLDLPVALPKVGGPAASVGGLPNVLANVGTPDVGLGGLPHTGLNVDPKVAASGLPKVDADVIPGVGLSGIPVVSRRDVKLPLGLGQVDLPIVNADADILDANVPVAGSLLNRDVKLPLGLGQVDLPIVNADADIVNADIPVAGSLLNRDVKLPLGLGQVDLPIVDADADVLSVKRDLLGLGLGLPVLSSLSLPANNKVQTEDTLKQVSGLLSGLINTQGALGLKRDGLNNLNVEQIQLDSTLRTVLSVVNGLLA